MNNEVREDVAAVLRQMPVLPVLYGAEVVAETIVAKLAERAFERAVKAWLVDNEPGTPDAWQQRDLLLAVAAALGIEPREVPA